MVSAAEKCPAEKALHAGLSCPHREELAVAEPPNLQPFLLGIPTQHLGSSCVEGKIDTFATPRRLLTVGNVAKRLSVSERTIRYWAELGELPGFKIGPGNKLWRFDPGAIENYLKGRESQSPPDGNPAQRPNEKSSATTANAVTAEYSLGFTRSKSEAEKGRSGVTKDGTAQVQQQKGLAVARKASMRDERTAARH